MSKLRWIHRVLVLGLVMAFVIATYPTVTASAALAQPAAQAATGQSVLTTAELHSLHAVYLKEQNIRLLETSDGPLGFEGGFSALSQCR